MNQRDPLKTLIIAEAGVNHNGDISLARQLIDVAADVGADFVKFQTFTADKLVTKNAKKAEYQNQTTDDIESQYDMIRKLEFDRDAHLELMACCEQKEVEFLSSPFDHKSIDLLNELGMKRFKIPSGEITNLPYLRHIGSYSKSVILSTGMATMDEIETALDVLELVMLLDSFFPTIKARTYFLWNDDDLYYGSRWFYRSTFNWHTKRGLCQL